MTTLVSFTPLTVILERNRFPSYFRDLNLPYDGPAVRGEEGIRMIVTVHYLLIVSHYIIILWFIARITSSLGTINLSLCADKTSHYPCLDINTWGWQGRCRFHTLPGMTVRKACREVTWGNKKHHVLLCYHIFITWKQELLIVWYTFIDSNVPK